jgi:hypothetical protein
MTRIDLAELERVAGEAASYIGQVRLWTPYSGARPVECTVFNCGASANFTSDGMKTSVGIIWTHYMDRQRQETVWFPRDLWVSMPLVRSALEPFQQEGKTHG